MSGGSKRNGPMNLVWSSSSSVPHGKGRGMGRGKGGGRFTSASKVAEDEKKKAEAVERVKKNLAELSSW